MTSTISNNWFSLTVVDDSYYEFTLLTHIEISVNHIKEIVEAQKALGGRRLPTLVIGTKFSTTNVETMKYIAENANFPYSSAGAYVIYSLSQRMMGNFYLKLNKPQRPTRFFNSVEEARQWIKDFIILNFVPSDDPSLPQSHEIH